MTELKVGDKVVYSRAFCQMMGATWEGCFYRGEIISIGGDMACVRWYGDKANVMVRLSNMAKDPKVYGPNYAACASDMRDMVRLRGGGVQ